MKLRNRWLIRGAAFLTSWLLRCWLATLRVRGWVVDGRSHPPDPSREPCIYAFWHESLLAPLKITTKARVLVSQSNDGNFSAAVCEHLKIGVVRGSSRRGGAKALLELLRGPQQGHLAITPDGPLGPRRDLKAGIVFLASQSGMAIVPLGIGFTRARRLGSWDRFALPWPFSTVVGVVGEPIVVPPDIDNPTLESYRRRVEDSLRLMTEIAEHWAERLAAGHDETPWDSVRGEELWQRHAAHGVPATHLQTHKRKGKGERWIAKN